MTVPKNPLRLGEMGNQLAFFPTKLILAALGLNLRPGEAIMGELSSQARLLVLSGGDRVSFVEFVGFLS